MLITGAQYGLIHLFIPSDCTLLGIGMMVMQLFCLGEK